MAAGLNASNNSSYPPPSIVAVDDEESSIKQVHFPGHEWEEVDDNEPNAGGLPSINERLAYLRPSRELLEYYRKKIGEFDDEHDIMLQKLDKYRVTYEEQHKMQWEMRQREEEIAELQKALSDMQVYLFQEREHVLRLYAENDRLKINELECHKKIQTLLSLTGMTEKEVSYFMKEPPAKAIVTQKIPPKMQAEMTRANMQSDLLKNNIKKQNMSRQKKGVLTEDEEKYNKDNQTLMLQVDALQAQLQEQTKLAKEQVESLLEERRVKIEEYDTRRQRDEDKIKTLTEKLHRTQDLLYDSTKDFLQLKYEFRGNEKKWMAEKDRLLRELDGLKSQQAMQNMRGEEETDVLNLSIEAIEGKSQTLRQEVANMEYQAKQAHKLADMYREQVIQLEDEMARIREEGDVGKELFKERSDKMAKRLELMNARYADLERRRNLEVEGFKTDIKNLRTKLKEVERQLYKVTTEMTDDLDIPARPEDIDFQILKKMHRTSKNSHKLLNELKRIKARVYGLENEMSKI